MNAIFFTMTISAQLMFLRVATRWPSLVRAAGRVESAFRRAYGPPRRLRARMHLVTAAGLALAFGEPHAEPHAVSALWTDRRYVSLGGTSVDSPLLHGDVVARLH